MSVAAWFGVALLGGLGACARFVIDVLISARFNVRFPLATLVVNASGSLLLGLLAGASLGGEALVLAGGATLGSYTTFSTWMLDTQRLAEEARPRAAVLNVLFSLAAGIAAVVVGRAIA